MVIEYTTVIEDEIVRYLDYIDENGLWEGYAEDPEPKKKPHSKYTLQMIAEKFKMNKESKNVFVKGKVCIEEDDEYILWREDSNGDYVSELETDDLIKLAKALKQIALDKSWKATA